MAAEPMTDVRLERGLAMLALTEEDDIRRALVVALEDLYYTCKKKDLSFDYALGVMRGHFLVIDDDGAVIDS